MELKQNIFTAEMEFIRVILQSNWTEVRERIRVECPVPSVNLNSASRNGNRTESNRSHFLGSQLFD
jgi:hypothetical protein